MREDAGLSSEPQQLNPHQGTNTNYKQSSMTHTCVKLIGKGKVDPNFFVTTGIFQEKLFGYKQLILIHTLKL